MERQSQRHREKGKGKAQGIVALYRSAMQSPLTCGISVEPLATYMHSSEGKVPEMQHVASANLVKMRVRRPVGQQAQRQRGHGPMAAITADRPDMTTALPAWKSGSKKQ